MTVATPIIAKVPDQCPTTSMCGQRANGLNNHQPFKVDYLEAGSSGPVVMLVHSSVSGARQWRRLMDDLKDQFRVRAVNLFGYGKTPSWPAEATQTLSDQARLVEAALPPDAGEIYLVGHSFGGSVAMKVAARLAGRIARLVLLETNPFYLLAQAGRMDAFAEAMELRNYIKKFGALGEWATAAEKFADYWNGAGTWRKMSFDRRIAFSEALKPNFFEWDAVMNETTPAEQWAALLPQRNVVSMRSWHGFAHPRDHGNPASVLSQLGLRGGAWSRSHGPAHAPGPGQSAGRLFSGARQQTIRE